jgi:cytochrome c peroxidase
VLADRRLLTAIGAALVSGAIVAAGFVLTSGAAQAPAGDNAAALAALKATFRRPTSIPFPANNPFSEEKRALGERLFSDVRLSASGGLACATCHQRTLGFADGRIRSLGASGKPLGRHTPTLWNLAWASHVFWDGRARSLEEQVTNPIESSDEMGQKMEPLIERLRIEAIYAEAFKQAFPEDPRVTRENLAKAIATYERTFLSPVTRFDRWIEGDETALTQEEVRGFRIFAGKAGCANCHSGFAFSDQAFHDTGLPDDDRGRGAILRLPAAEHAFKTPGLREVARSAPYMHDGSLATLDEVVRHYESGVADRPTLSPDLPRRLSITDAERAALVAFLGTLTSEDEPALPAKTVPAPLARAAAAERVATVMQQDKNFNPTRVAMHVGERVWILNNDTRTHNVRVFDDAFEFDSGAQEPGETVEIAFPAAGSFLVFCGIHPKMELRVDVE